MSEKIIRFERGLPGFSEEKEFILLLEDKESPFGYLQSVKTEGLSFIVVSPYVFFGDYEIVLSDDVLDRLGITNENEVFVLSIVTIRDNNVKDATANLVAPVVINVNTLKGEQVILEGTKYTTRHLLFPQSIKVGGE